MPATASHRIGGFDATSRRAAAEDRESYLGLIRQPFVLRPGARAPLLASLMVITQIANAAGYLWERLVARAKSVRTDRPGWPSNVLVRDTREARSE